MHRTAERPTPHLARWARFALSFTLACGSLLVDARADGRLLATGGVTEIEGSAGGGLVPWALIAGYGTRDEIGVQAHYTQVELRDFRLRTAGVAVGLFDRVELSLARQRFGLGSTVPGRSIEQDVVGAKLKVYGDAVYDQDTPWPQVALGVQYKRNRDFDAVPKALGARRATGTDAYLAATKLYLSGLLGRNVLLDATVRATRGNQFGLLGFGGDRGNGYRLRFEGSAAVFLDDRFAIGYELRTKPDNLSAYREETAQDVFVAWVPNKRVAITAAYVRLGRIANHARQDGVYLSLQVGR